MRLSSISRLLSKALVRRHSVPASVPIRRIFVDVSEIVRGDAQTGIQRVVRAICQQLAATGLNNVCVQPVAATRVHGYMPVVTDILPQERDVTVASIPELLSFGPGDVFLGLDLSAHLLPRYWRQLRRWKTSGALLAIVVYDLLPYAHPEWFSRKLVKRFRQWLRVVGDYADLVLPISRSVDDDLSAYFNNYHRRRSGQIVHRVLPLSGDISASRPTSGRPIGADDLLVAMKSRSSFLAVGTVEPRKGHLEVLAAHRHVWQADSTTAPYLIIVGKAGWKTEVLQAELSGYSLTAEGVIWLNSVSDEFLDELYRTCSAVIVASLGEGYCLPLHEAIARGRLVLARDLPVLREFQSPLVRYFESDEPAALGARMLALVSEGAPEQVDADQSSWGRTVEILSDALMALVNLREVEGGVSDVRFSSLKNGIFLGEKSISL